MRRLVWLCGLGETCGGELESATRALWEAAVTIFSQVCRGREGAFPFSGS